MSSVTLQAVLKRALPFFATFAVALFITSFFVDLNRPRFFRGHGKGRFHEIQQLRQERDELKYENMRLKYERDVQNRQKGFHNHEECEPGGSN